MHKIFAKEKCVCLIDDKALFKENEENRLIAFENHEQLFREHTRFTEQKKYKFLYVYSPNLQLLWTVFTSLFKLIEAAGGVVKNDKNEFLLIYRHDCWDLPKGKLEKKEKMDVAAIREVQEECGLQAVEIVSQLPITFHTYTYKNKQALKKTYWYEMRSTGSDKVSPQLDEGITDVKWMNEKEVRQAMTNTYPLIQEVLKTFVV